MLTQKTHSPLSALSLHPQSLFLEQVFTEMLFFMACLLSILTVSVARMWQGWLPSTQQDNSPAFGFCRTLVAD